MALHKNFPKDKFAILTLEIRWFPVDEALREQGAGKIKLNFDAHQFGSF